MAFAVISLLYAWTLLPLLTTGRDYRGYSDGEACVFPFAYKGRTFYTCTREDDNHERLWCATTGSLDKNNKWTYCTDTRQRGNAQGPCVFPFTYNGKIYSSCTTDGSSNGKPWCSLTSNFDEYPKRTYCEPSEPLPCVFPFIFRERSYSACTRDGAGDNVLWCATTDNYDRDTKWTTCSLPEYEENSKGQACVFPFSYKNRTFFTCTNENEKDGRFWCGTSGSYDKERKWTYCDDTRLDAKPKGPCIFPFLYNGKSYSTCTTDGSSTGQLWCSLTSNHDEDPQWTYCKPSEHRPCVFPFKFNKRFYSACTRDGAGDNVLWCATTADYDRDTKWKPCSIQEYEGSSEGKPCVFPFIYKNRTFYTCTNEATGDGRFWCATTRNYDKDNQWSYCADSRLDDKPKGPCVFPFIYKGKSHSSCIMEEARDGKQWCSLTSNYDVDPKWTYCDHSGE